MRLGTKLSFILILPKESLLLISQEKLPVKKTKFSISVKILFGYVLLAGFGALAIWFIYSTIREINTPQVADDSQKKMGLISEAATRLYTAEGISRNIIQNKDTLELVRFRHSIDTISMLLGSLKELYEVETTRNELDSIGSLLELKEANLLELLEFRRENASENYYDRVLKRLEKADYLFGSTDYKQMVKGLQPYQQKLIIDYLQYGEEENANRLTHRTADELINTTKQVLLSLELQEHEYQKRISEKENQLLVNDFKISDRLRKIRSKIEQEEIQKSLEAIEARENALSQTNLIMILFGIACLITILIFGVIIIRDVKKSKLYRKELETAKSYAEQLLHSREQIMATVTHDLRSPLSSILGYADLMDKTDLNSKQKNYLNKLRKSSDFTMKLVNDLLDLTRLEAGHIKIDQLPFVPASLIEDVVYTHIPSPDPKNLKIEMEVEGNLHNNFVSDPFRIQQVLGNILGNAYKFTEKGSIKIKAGLIYQGLQKQLEISVTDTGIGIRPEKLTSVFEEFSQADEVIQRKYGGFGLGLTISKKIIELLNGRIDVESEWGRGTTFIITIPVEESLSDIQLENIKKLRIKNVSQQRVLVVDDERSQRKLIQEILKISGFEIDLAENGEEALEKLKNATFDVVFTDIQMPKMNGIDLLKQVRKHPELKDLPVIALSGMTDKSLEEFLALGFSAYVIKPYTINSLLKAVSEVLHLEIEETSTSKKQESTTSKTESEGYDLADLKSFIEDDEEALQMILNTMIESTEANLKILQAAYQKKELETIGFTAHKMLPMLRQIKADVVTQSLEILESKAAVDLSWDEIEDLIENIETHTHILLSDLRQNVL